MLDDEFRSAKLRFGAGVVPVIEEPASAGSFEHSVFSAFAYLIGRSLGFVVVDAAVWNDSDSMEN